MKCLDCNYWETGIPCGRCVYPGITYLLTNDKMVFEDVSKECPLIKLKENNRISQPKANNKIAKNVNFDLLCEKSIQEIRRNNEVFNKIKDTPEMILKDIYKEKCSYNSLTNTIKTFGKKYTIHDFQKYLYNLLIPFLEKNLDNEYNFTYNTSTYPALIKISYQKYDLAFVDIQYQVLTLCHPLHIDIHKKNLDSFTEMLEKKKKSLIKLEEAGMNPFKLCEGNVIGFFDVILNYNKIKNKRQDVLNQLNKEIKLYEERINELENKIKEEEMIEDDIKNCTQELISFFSNYDYICRGM